MVFYVIYIQTKIKAYFLYALYLSLFLSNTIQLSADTARQAKENADRERGRTKMFDVHKTKYTGLGGMGGCMRVCRPAKCRGLVS